MFFPIMEVCRGSIFIVVMCTAKVLVTSIYEVLEQYQEVSVTKVHLFLIMRIGNKNVIQQDFKKSLYVEDSQISVFGVSS